MSPGRAKFQFARRMQLRGFSDREIARTTGVSYGTLRYRRTLTRPPRTMLRGRRSIPESWRPPDASSYAYLLGLYLGDGCLGVQGSGAQLVINLDQRYPTIIAEAVRQSSIRPRRFM